MNGWGKGGREEEVSKAPWKGTFPMLVLFAFDPLSLTTFVGQLSFQQIQYNVADGDVGLLNTLRVLRGDPYGEV
jgi:hypothetical protein